MPDNEINERLSLDDYKGRYVVLFFYPLDFTFVCPSEILAFDNRLRDFHDRQCELIAVSGKKPMQPTPAGVKKYLRELNLNL